MIFTREKKEHWTFWNRFIFKFLFCYVGLYTFSMLFGKAWSPIIHWLGDNVFNLNYSFSNKGYGSGDTTYAYIQLFLLLFIALLTSILLSLTTNKKIDYNTLFWVFRVFIRVFLIYFLLVYGFSKVFYLQFPSPSLNRLLQPIGNISPMGLAWTFMGYSKTYTIFSGLIEVFAGLLLISKRLQTLGALLTVAVMTNVFMMNLCYDIPVKLFSFHLLGLGFILLLTDFKRLYNVLFRNTTVKKTTFFSPYSHDKEVVKTIKYLKIVLAIGLSGFFIQKNYSYSEKRKAPNNTSKLYGIWETQYFIKNNDTIPALITDTNRWHYLIIDLKNRTTIKTMDGDTNHYNIQIDSTSRNIDFHKLKSDSKDFNFTYNLKNKDQLRLQGIINTDSLNIIFSYKDENDFLLPTRGFNWINETPFNR